MANEVVERELAVANVTALNEDDEGTDGKNELNIRNMDVTTVAGDTQDDTALKTQDRRELDDQMLDAVDDPPDSFFDGLLEDDFLDSLAVVDAWNPDNDESCGSNADEQQENNTSRGRSGRNRQTPSESKRKNESISKRSLSKGGRVSSDHRRSRDDSHRKDDRRHAGTSVEVKQDSKERSAGGTADRSRKVGIVEHLRDVKKRYENVRDRDRDRRDADRTDRKERESRYRRDRKSRERDAEKNVHGGGSGSSSRENNDKSTEKSIEKCDKGRGHRHSNQFGESNRGTTLDKAEKERKSDLPSISVDGKDGVLQNIQDSSRRDDVKNEGLRKEKISDINVGNKEIQIGSVHNEHDIKKEISLGPSHITEGVKGDQNHMFTRPHNTALNDTKLDTCIKELDDLLPPGTESDFILPIKDEIVEFKKENNTKVKEESEFGIVNDSDLLSGDWKSFRNPVKKTDRAEKEIHVAGERSADRKLLEGVERGKDPSSTSSQRSHKEAERLDSSRGRKRRRSGSCSSERGRSSASRSKKRRDRLDEERKRKPRNSSSEEKKRNPTSLEKKLGAVQVKSDRDEIVRRKTLYGSDSGRGRSRSRSRGNWQHHSDPHRLERKKVDKNDTRRSRSGSRGKKRELSVGRERTGRSRSRDRQYRKTLNDTRRSRSGSRGKKRELSVGRERTGRSRSRANTED